MQVMIYLSIILVVLSSIASGYLGLYETVIEFGSMSWLYVNIKPRSSPHWLLRWTVKLKERLFGFVVEKRSLLAAAGIVLFGAATGWIAVAARIAFEDFSLVIAREIKETTIDIFFLPPLVYLMALGLDQHFENYESEEEFDKRQAETEARLDEKYGLFGKPDNLSDLMQMAGRGQSWERINLGILFGMILSYLIILSFVIIPYLVGYMVSVFAPIQFLENIRVWVPSWI